MTPTAARWPTFFVLALALTMVVSACANGASPTAPTSPPQTTSPSPEEQETDTPEPTETGVPTPTGDLGFRIGFPGSVGLKQLPAAITAERLNSAGWNIELVEFSEGSIATEALAQGEIQLLSGVAFLVLLARHQGADVSVIAEQNALDFVMASRREIASCDDMAGQRFGLHNLAGDLTNLVYAWMETCGAEPEYLVIPGSENRAAAMLADQLDATGLDLAAWLDLEMQSDDFHLLARFADDYEDISLAYWSANDEWVLSNRDVAVAFVAELLLTHRMVYEDPSILLRAAEDRDTGDDSAAISAYLDLEAFAVNGGVDEDVIRGTIAFYEASDQLPPGLEVGAVFDGSILDDALNIVGTIPDRD
jgi:ABC-type nitrate/sulfonate/bicarbonate transport system substrate-binding protein